VGIFISSRSFVGNSSFFFVRPTQGGATGQHAVETVWRLKMKGFSKISL
jgi:hypothetical protein